MIDLTKKYRTKNGKDVELISDKGRGDYPIIGYFEGREALATWTQDGRYILAGNSCSDLIEVKEKKKVWGNLHEDMCGAIYVLSYSSPENAEMYKDVYEKYIKTVEIEYEVGE
jgi:hypothetical protein